MNDFNTYENEIFDEIPDLVIGINANNCTFNLCENTTFERCNLENCTFLQDTRFYKSNVIDCVGVDDSEFILSNKIDGSIVDD